MKIVARQDSEKRTGKTALSFEYDMGVRELNLAPITIRGRYPETGYASNTIVTSLIYVIKGSGVCGVSDGTEHILRVGDQVRIDVNDAYYFDGDVDILYAATPAWTPEQAKHLL